VNLSSVPFSEPFSVLDIFARTGKALAKKRGTFGVLYLLARTEKKRFRK
jgi:hypothetical protein